MFLQNRRISLFRAHFIHFIHDEVSVSVAIDTVLKKLIFFGSDTEISLRMTTINDNIRFNGSTRELIVNKSFNITDGNPTNVYVNLSCTTSPGITVSQPHSTFKPIINYYSTQYLKLI